MAAPAGIVRVDQWDFPQRQVTDTSPCSLICTRSRPSLKRHPDTARPGNSRTETSAGMVSSLPAF